MSRIVLVMVGLGLAAVACSSSSYQLHPKVEKNDPNRHYIEQYATVLSYEAESVVAVSGRRNGDELVLTVAIRNASEDGIAITPEGILVAAGDPTGLVRTLPALSPGRYLERQAAASGTKLALHAASIEWEARQNLRVATETTRVDEVSLDAAGQFFGRSEAPDPWSSVARRTVEIRGEAEAYDGFLQSLSRGLLWPQTLEPGEYTFGKVICPDPENDVEFHVIVPVGRDRHEFVLVSPAEASPLLSEPALTSN